MNSFSKDKEEKMPGGVRGRGASKNFRNRFEKAEYAELLDVDSYRDPEDERLPAPKTRFYEDRTRTILARNDSPDIGFSASINPYRGCEHGCIYCYARPTHEYFGLSAGLDFETKIFVKTQAAQLLRKELESPRWKPQCIAISGVTDCYQPAERKFELTRSCLKVLGEFRNPVAIVTKNHLVTRDKDLLASLARHECCAVNISITSLDNELISVMEPRTSRPQSRLQAISELSSAGIPVGVLVAPIIPGLTDHELPAILKSAADAGAKWAHFVILRLPFTVRPIFMDWLSEKFPEKKSKVVNRIQAVRGGNLNDPRFGSRMQGEGEYAEQIAKLFSVVSKKVGLSGSGPKLSTSGFQRPRAQLSLFKK